MKCPLGRAAPMVVLDSFAGKASPILILKWKRQHAIEVWLAFQTETENDLA
jgi:hypothetical protein